MSTYACGDDSSPSSKQSIIAAECNAGALEPDLDASPFEGPGVDPNSGELKLGADTKYVVSSTYGQPIPGPDGAPITPEYMQIFAGIQAQLKVQPGLVALRLASSEACGSGRTLAIWESEAAMYSFVTSDAHATAMAAVHQILQPSYAVTHWSASGADQTTFDYASKQLAAKVASR